MKKHDISLALAGLALLAACGGGGSPAPAGDGSDTPVTPPPVQTDERAAVRGLGCTGPDSSGWCWQDPQPGPQVLASLSFVDGRSGYAGGEGGLVVRTTDGGRSWQRLAQAGASDLLGLRIDAQGRGWAWNQRGEAYRSTDGGAHWQEPWSTGPVDGSAWQLADGALLLSTGQVQVSGSASGPDCLSAPSAVLGRIDAAGWQPLALAPLLVTQAGTAPPTLHGVAGPCGERWGRSTDGGRSFEAQTDIDPAWRLQAMGDGGERLWALLARPRFDEFGNFGGWTEPRLVRSADDGRHWGDAVSVPDDLDPNRLVLRDGVGALAAGPELLRSLDGGRSWQPLPLPAGAVWPTLHNRDWVLVPLADGSAWVSADLGRTWTATAVLPQLPVRLLDPGDGSLAWMSTDLRARRSADGGRSFATIPWAPAGPSVRELHFFDARDGLALTLDGALRRTSDGGRQWQTDAALQGLRGLHAAADGSAWALQGDRLLRSTDRGRTWASLDLPAEVVATGPLLDARRVDARNGWVRTEQRTCIVAPRPICYALSSHLFVTEDGGATWALRATLGLGETDRAVAMAAGGRLLRITQDGRVLRSANAGRDWIAVPGISDPQSASATPQSIVWLDAGHVWLHAFDRVWRSSDGGVSWQSAPSPELPFGNRLFVQAMAFADPLNGWAVGFGAHLMRTADGGASWQLQNTDASYGFYTVFALDARQVWLGGHQGVMATATGGR